MRFRSNQPQLTSLEANQEEIDCANQQITAVDYPDIPQAVVSLLGEVRALEENMGRLAAAPQLDQRQQVALSASRRSEILADIRLEAKNLLEDRDHELFDLTGRIDDALSTAIAQGDNQSAYLLGKALGDHYSKLRLFTAATSVYRLTDSFARERFNEAKDLLDSLSPLDIERAFRQEGISDQAMLTGDTSLLAAPKPISRAHDISKLRVATRHSMAKRYIEQGIKYHASWQKNRILASASGQILDVYLARTATYRQLIQESPKAFRQLADEQYEDQPLMQELTQMAADTYQLEPINNVDAAYRVVFNCHLILTKLAPFYKPYARIGHKRMCKRMSRYNYLSSGSGGMFNPSSALARKEVCLDRLRRSICVGFNFDKSAIIE